MPQINRLHLLKEVVSADILENKDNKVVFDTDFNSDIDRRISEIIKEVQNTHVAPTDDGYSVKVKLKDDSIFAYTPHRFAHTE